MCTYEYRNRYSQRTAPARLLNRIGTHNIVITAALHQAPARRSLGTWKQPSRRKTTLISIPFQDLKHDPITDPDLH